MAQSLSSLNYHLVFSTKNRVTLISDEIEEDLHRYVAGILRNHRGPCFGQVECRITVTG